MGFLQLSFDKLREYPFYQGGKRHVLLVQPFLLEKDPCRFDVWRVDERSLVDRDMIVTPEDVGVEYHKYVKYLIKKYADSGEYSGIVSPEIDKELKWTLTADAASQTYKAINDLKIPLEIGKKYPTASKDQKNERVNRMLEHVHNAVKGYNNRSPKPSTPITGLRITSIYNNKIAPHKRLGAVDLAGYGDCFRQDGEHGNGFDPDEMIAFLTLLMRSRGDKNESTKFFQSFIVECPYVVKRLNEAYYRGKKRSLDELLDGGPNRIVNDGGYPHYHHIHVQNGLDPIRDPKLGTQMSCTECILIDSCTKLERKRVLEAVSVNNKRKEDISVTIDLQMVAVAIPEEQSDKETANVASGENHVFYERVTFVGGQWIGITVGGESHYIDLRSKDVGDITGQDLDIRITVEEDEITAIHMVDKNNKLSIPVTKEKP